METKGHRYSALPRITYITEVEYQEHSLRKVGRQVVVCNDNLRYRCGLRIEDAGVGWSVLFTSVQIGDAERIAREAAQLLEGYRSS